MTTIQVCHLDGRQFATNFIGEYGISPFDTWGWVVGCLRSSPFAASRLPSGLRLSGGTDDAESQHYLHLATNPHARLRLLRDV